MGMSAMERGSIYYTLGFIVSFLPKTYTSHRIFNCGLYNGYSEEYEAVIDGVINKTSGWNNASLILRKYNTSENIDLFHQASSFLDQNIIVLIEGANTKTHACAVSIVTGIPLIRLHGDSRSYEQCEKAIQMSVGYRDYGHAALDILITFGWKTIPLLFDEESFHEAAYFHAISQNSELVVDLVQLIKPNENEDPKAPVLRAMEELKKFAAEAIILFIDKEIVERIVQQMPYQERDGRNVYKWILLREVPMNFNFHRESIVLSLTLPFNQRSAPNELINAGNTTNMDFSALAHDAVKVLKQAINSKPCRLINGTSISLNDRETMLKCLKKVSTDGLTGPIQFNERGTRTGIELEILNLRNNSFKRVGTWNSTKGVSLFDNISRNMGNPSEAERLDRRRLRIVVVENAPFMMAKKLEDGSISYTGYCIDLLNELKRKLKFTYDIYSSPDGKYGVETENGTWNGMIGELLSERADMVVADLTITERREEVVDFSVPYMYYTKEMLLKKTTSRETINLLQFLNPFDKRVWLATIASLVVSSIAVFVINYFSPYGYKDDNGRGTSQEFSFFNSLWFALACMLQQGADHSPRGLSGRILAGCYWFFILISISTYTANLAAFLTIKNAVQPINNLEDIVKSSYQVAVVEAGSAYEAFKMSQYETYKKIWYRIQTGGTAVQSASEGTQLVRERQDFVFITDGPTLRYIANQPPCDLTVVPGLKTANGLALALQAKDPHINDFTLAILRLHENRFLEKLKRKWWENNVGCPQEQETSKAWFSIAMQAQARA